MKRSLSMSQVVFHPSALAVFSGLLGALIGFLLNLASGGKTSQLLWIALIFAMLFSLSITAWQGYRQEQTGRQWMTMLQEMVFQTYFLTLLADKPEISQLAQQRLQANLSRVNLREANLSEAILHRADLSGANLSQSSLKKADLRGVNLQGANLIGADLSESRMTMEKAGRDAPRVQIGARRYPALRANLSHALLTQARLRESNLVGADFSGANLQGGDLTRANLSYANLQGANLTGATLTEAALICTCGQSE